MKVHITSWTKLWIYTPPIANLKNPCKKKYTSTLKIVAHSQNKPWLLSTIQLKSSPVTTTTSTYTKITLLTSHIHQK